MADTTQNELEAAEAKIDMSGEVRREVSDDLRRERAELARLARKLRGRFGV